MWSGDEFFPITAKIVIEVFTNDPNNVRRAIRSSGH